MPSNTRSQRVRAEKSMHVVDWHDLGNHLPALTPESSIWRIRISTIHKLLKPSVINLPKCPLPIGNPLAPGKTLDWTKVPKCNRLLFHEVGNIYLLCKCSESLGRHQSGQGIVMWKNNSLPLLYTGWYGASRQWRIWVGTHVSSSHMRAHNEWSKQRTWQKARAYCL